MLIKALLVAVNAKYIHTNPAVRSIAAYSRARFRRPLEYIEFTINQRHAEILRALYQSGADCFAFSCYIWNIECVKRLIADLKKLLPKSTIILGGPEADWQADALLRTQPQMDIIVHGEGEQTTCLLLEALHAGTDPDACPGISLRHGDGILRTESHSPPDLAELPFPYDDLHALDGRIPYYESMRGCPFSCSYCLSSRSMGVRLRPLGLVFDELRLFLNARVRQVKFVDRTFNCNPGRAMEIWRFLSENDNGLTNFHFEMAGDLLDDDSIAFLATVRPGLFQFEIGVQSTHPPTLAAIHRGCGFDALARQVRALRRAGNIHLHLDLIAGLPHEDYARFSRSFDEVYRLVPHQLQLGFLKLLGGSRLREEAERYGIAFQDTAPYEVLQTACLSYDELCVLHGVDEMVDSFYNSGRFRYLLEYIAPHFSTPFAFYRALWTFFDRRQQGAPLSKIGYYDLLGAFMAANGIPITVRAQWLCLYDLMLHEKPRKLPDWITVDLCGPDRARLGSARRRAGGDAHLQCFPFAPPGGPDGECVVRFDYGRRDITGRARTSILEAD